MAVSDLLKNGIADITGTVEKAIIRVCDESLADDLEKKDGIKTKTPSGNSMGIGGGIAASVMGEAQNAAKNAADNAIKSMANDYAALANIKNTILKDQAIDYNREFTVQFNPSSMQLTSYHYTSTDITKADGSQADQSIGRTSPYPDMVFSVNLLFERVVAEEAFVQDTMFKSISTLGKTAVKAGFDAITGGFETVQNMVEGFVGVIRNQRTRRICFSWNNMSYEGVLNNVRSKYTMFDLYGRPIRGEVYLSIRLSDMQVSETNMGYWQDAYDNAFGFDPNAEGMYGKLKNAANTISSAANTVSTAALQTVNMASQAAGMVGGLSDQIYTSLFGDEIKEKQQKEFEETYTKKKEEEDLATEKQQKENADRKRKERSFVSGQINDRIVSVDEEKRSEARKTDAERNRETQKSINDLIGEQEDNNIPMQEAENIETGENGLIDM